MKSVVINENQKGFLFENGKYIKTLNAGKYMLFGGRKIEVVELSRIITSAYCTLDTLMADPAFAAQVSVVEVGDEQIVLHYVNDKFVAALYQHGKYAFWNACEKHDFYPVDLSNPEVGEDVPRFIFDKIQTSLYQKVEIEEYEKGQLFINKRFVRILEPGTYYFWRTENKVEVKHVDTRLTRLTVNGQEIMTQDKVALRINFVCNYRISDYVKIFTEVDDYEDQLHVVIQLALRDFVGKYKLDEILEAKEELGKYVLEQLKSKESTLFVKIESAGVVDIILPGEIRSIMNTVLVAEKKAQANVITRREEVASTRSLLNTAKLMDENKTLYKLKELEYVERICENVGNINLNGGDVLNQLLAMVGDR